MLNNKRLSGMRVGAKGGAWVQHRYRDEKYEETNRKDRMRMAKYT